MPYRTFGITSIALIIALRRFLILSLSDTLCTNWPSCGTLCTYLTPLSFLLRTAARGSTRTALHLARNHSVIAQATSPIGIFYQFPLELIEWSLYTYSRPIVVTIHLNAFLICLGFAIRLAIIHLNYHVMTLTLREMKNLPHLPPI